MTDTVDKATRSRMMAAIRSTNTRPELLVRSALHRRGFRFRLHGKRLPGRPDLVFRRYRAVIFVHGCFWHGHRCPMSRMPQSRTEYWQKKIRRNRERDQQAVEALSEAGWRSLTVWECAVRRTDSARLAEVFDEITLWLTGDSARREVAGLAADDRSQWRAAASSSRVRKD